MRTAWSATVISAPCEGLGYLGRVCFSTPSCALLIAITALCAGHVCAQTVPIANPSFEQGGEKVDGWTLTGKGRVVTVETVEGRRAIVVEGGGEDSSSWRSTDLALEPMGVYRMRFAARRLEGGGAVTSGPSFCNRDVQEINNAWQQINTIFAVPSDPKLARTFLRLGQWHMSGAAAFDAVELCRAYPLHARFGDLELGEGESLRGQQYVFQAPLQSDCRNYSRSLHEFTASFNTNRWVLGNNNTFVTYRHALAKRTQTHATVTASVTWYSAGQLLIEASTDNKTWRSLGALHKVGRFAGDIPGELLPAKEIYVRLKAVPAEGKSAVGLQVGGYSYGCQLDRPAPASQTLTGSTHFLAVEATDDRATLSVVSLGDMRPGGNNLLLASLRRNGDLAAPLHPTLTIAPKDAPPTTFGMEMAGGKSEADIRLPYEITTVGNVSATLTLGKNSAFKASLLLNVPALYDCSYGRRLPGSSEAPGLWWCSSGWKVSQTRPLPPATSVSSAVELRLAGNESEAVQLVVRPAKALTNFTARATELRGPGGIIPAEHISVRRVGYVNISHPTDPTGCIGAWPDPLPPITAPLALTAAQNQPLWICVKAPRGTKAGQYSGSIQLRADGHQVDVPLKVQVYGFSLPDRLTCVAAFGFSPGDVWRYQKIDDPEQRRAVLDKYFASFGSHHISPYNPAPLDPFKVTWPKKSAPLNEMVVKFDFDAWDKAVARALEKYHFNSFSVPTFGLGGGTFQQRYEPKLIGYGEDTPQYKALIASYLTQLESHLKQKGWLDMAYVYWFDEPEPKDYEFVSNGFRKLKQHAPGIGRMLTEQIEEALLGGPNIWCPLTPHFDAIKAKQRRQQGEKFWWYVCCSPHAPYCTEFIDHPGVELRTWLWQTWQRRIDGILIWQTNYWNSTAAYPDKDHPQNPYEDPMSWVSGNSAPAGARQPWGNGDGRFLYPPLDAADAKPAKPVLDGPVESIRWEMLRDGLEDYEYLAILRGLLQKKGSALPPQRRADFEKLLEVPAEITADATTFSTDPARIEARRDAVARAIEALTAP